MDIKDIKLTLGANKDVVNALISEYLDFEDDKYINANYRHNWKCKCGKTFKRTWTVIKNGRIVDCGCIKYNKVEDRYKYEVEKTGEYEYIRSFRRGDILPNGRVVKAPYLQIKHKNCNSIYEIAANNFININQRCRKCCGGYENSFAHHIEVELGELLGKYWDFEKNTVNPYHISKYSQKKVWIKCINEEVNHVNNLRKKDYHESYLITCAHFSSGKRCSYCKNQYKVHPYDSFGYYHFDKVMYWHPDNKTSPFKVAKSSGVKYKFICYECGETWHMGLNDIARGRWCPECHISKGEKHVKKWLDKNNISYINDSEYFDDLRGIRGGFLRPDFILEDKKIWIEYDGEFHYKNFYKDGIYETQIYHDKLKNEYAKKNGWKMIRIPYWEFDNIEEILEKELRA